MYKAYKGAGAIVWSNSSGPKEFALPESAAQS
jgi:hypothetical protein